MISFDDEIRRIDDQIRRIDDQIRRAEELERKIEAGQIDESDPEYMELRRDVEGEVLLCSIQEECAEIDMIQNKDPSVKSLRETAHGLVKEKRADAEDIYLLEQCAVLDLLIERTVDKDLIATIDRLSVQKIGSGGYSSRLSRSIVGLLKLPSKLRTAHPECVRSMAWFVGAILCALDDKWEVVSDQTLKVYATLAKGLIIAARADKLPFASEYEKEIGSLVDNFRKNKLQIEETDSGMKKPMVQAAPKPVPVSAPPEPKKLYPRLKSGAEKERRYEELYDDLLNMRGRMKRKEVSFDTQIAVTNELREELIRRLNKSKSSGKVEREDMLLAEKMLLITDGDESNCMTCFVHLNNYIADKKPKHFGYIADRLSDIGDQVAKGRSRLFDHLRFAARKGRLIGSMLISILLMAMLIVIPDSVLPIENGLSAEIMGGVACLLTFATGLISGGIPNLILHYISAMVCMSVVPTMIPDHPMKYTYAATIAVSLIPLIYRLIKAFRSDTKVRGIREEYAHLPGTIESLIECADAMVRFVPPMFDQMKRHPLADEAFMKTAKPGKEAIRKNYAQLSKELKELLPSAKNLAEGKYT